MPAEKATPIAPRPVDQRQMPSGLNAPEPLGLGSNVFNYPGFAFVANENERARRGPIDGFVKTCERWRLDQSEQLVLLGYAGNDIGGRPVLAGRAKPSQDVIDRIGYVLSISLGLASLFNDNIANEVDWLKQPKDDLGGASPIATMMSGRMVDMMRIVTLTLKERAI